MKSKHAKYILFQIIFILNPFLSYSQSKSITSDIIVNIIPPTNNNVFYSMDIYQTFYIKGCDTTNNIILLSKSNINLKTKETDIKIKKITINKIEYNKSSKNNRKIQIPHNNNNKIDTVVVQYSYTGNIHSLVLMSENIKKIYYCDSQEEEWYFLNKNVQINNLSIFIPPNFTVFCNQQSLFVDTNQYGYKCTNIEETGINFFIINNNFYNKETIKIKNKIFSFYFLKNYNSLFNDSVKYIDFNKKHYDSLILNIDTSIKYLLTFFDDSIKNNIPVIELLWKYKGMYKGNYIVCDTSFLSKPNHNFTHELIHSLSKLNTVKSDTGKYFIEESLTEYLSIYFFYFNDNKKRNKFFNNKIIKYSSYSNNKYNSIFQIEKNDKKAWGIIYDRTPFIIHSFAISIGEEKFINLLKDFYSIKKDFVCWADFIEFLDSNGITKKQIEKFSEQL